MDMPWNAFLRHFGMFAKVFECERAGGGVVFLIGEVGSFDGGLILYAKSAIENGEVVVGGEIVGIDGLNVFVLGSREVVLVLLVEGESELAMGVAGLRELSDDLLQIGDRFVDFTLIALDQREVIEGARVVFGERQATSRDRALRRCTSPTGCR